MQEISTITEEEEEEKHLNQFRFQGNIVSLECDKHFHVSVSVCIYSLSYQLYYFWEFRKQIWKWVLIMIVI